LDPVSVAKPWPPSLGNHHLPSGWSLKMLVTDRRGDLVRDESLKKLLMAWYYAGYYTGLFEGQQQQSQPEKRSPGS
jgi:hypothetical protein